MLSEQHPLGGIYSGLLRAKTDSIFVRGCDMPFLRPRLIQALNESGLGYDAATPVWKNKPQPLCAIYSKNCLGALRIMIDQERFAIHELFGIVRTRFLLDEEIRAADPEGLSFIDIDTRADYEQAKKMPVGNSVATQ